MGKSKADEQKMREADCRILEMEAQEIRKRMYEYQDEIVSRENEISHQKKAIVTLRGQIHRDEMMAKDATNRRDYRSKAAYECAVRNAQISLDVHIEELKTAEEYLERARIFANKSKEELIEIQHRIDEIRCPSDA